MDSDLKDLDLYEVLEIQQTATEKDIKTAYRKKALQCHPDKNPDNPKAAQLFLQLSKILAVLTDTAARTAYDKLVNAKLAAKLREKEYDSKRKKLIDDLARREREALGNKKDTVERNFEKELERLRKESSALLAKEQAYVNELIKKQEAKKEMLGSFKLKVKWKENGVYDDDNLKSLFSKHGDVITIVVLGNKKCALIEYRSKTSAINAKNLEVGYPNHPLTVSFIGDYGQEAKKSSTKTSASDQNSGFSACQSKYGNETQNTTTIPATQTFSDYEAMILERFRQAGKRVSEN
ncbi:DNAJC17, RNA recognition motif,DnaJ domain,RNA recognition motif domain [Cinara cedri]|uniref:DNAJC17, RNA recognition motif,DnaJ domain,RNA recognition motif domain n=1 Tax=Cinara cedri TaxID=506608 RepID=A0A5E4MQ84_9HEMI|nr:DNAJC17, RNA recognition motif,DnaJ domain,RNA recognition motif domain [Cinara cedri]